MVQSSVDGVPSSRRWRRRLAAVLLIAILALAVAAVGLLIYIAAEASETLVYGDDAPHGCATPATMGWDWAYEAVNYDIALDAHLPVDNPHWLISCRNRGHGTAGDEVVSEDGIRVAGWYIPSGDGDPPTAPTVVVLHGWSTHASDTLRYADTMHDRYNLLLVELRSRGRSSGEQMTPFGVREYRDLEAMLDWLERTKAPSKIVAFGDSGGAATALKLARTDQRIEALIVDSVHARAANPIAQRLMPEVRKRLGALTPPDWLAVWLAEIGVWVRTAGAWPGDAEPIDSVVALGDRPLAIFYGTADTFDVPDRNAWVLFQAAQSAGVPVEIHACKDATHGQVVNTCSDEYRTWVTSFLERVIGP
jgi:pimeloyl-ACP methyl ester carboxylesterase